MIAPKLVGLCQCIADCNFAILCTLVHLNVIVCFQYVAYWPLMYNTTSFKKFSRNVSISIIATVIRSFSERVGDIGTESFLLENLFENHNKYPKNLVHQNRFMNDCSHHNVNDFMHLHFSDESNMKINY